MRLTECKYNCFRFKDKVAVLTASTQGIGYCTAERLAHEGAKIVISSRQQEHVDEAVEQLVHSGIPRENVAGTVCHVANPKHRAALIDLAIQRFGRIDILVSNAGINPALGSILDVDQVRLDRIFEVNVKCSFLLSRAVVPHMEKNGYMIGNANKDGGVIVFNSSVCAYRASPGMTTYGISKTALNALVHSLSVELASRGIRVNSVSEGPIRTKMGRVLYDKTHPKFSKDIEKTQVLSMSVFGRIGEPKEVASSICYLASDDASFVSGENHLVSGGVSCRL
ncbi:hypothetical protein M3Y98_01042000 [Aphelenchoides besseyi]|nr:hypothetical protein M3Y98_01042000 [Aphelenchoides besseyi]KAI6209865.1 hypothetical protein M3Y96_00266500 [Aphelenchoides besseyi]